MPMFNGRPCTPGQYVALTEITRDLKPRKASKYVGKRDANHLVARICGVNANDTRFEAAEKVIQVMKDSGLDPKAIKDAEDMLAKAKKAGGFDK